MYHQEKNYTKFNAISGDNIFVIYEDYAPDSFNVTREKMRRRVKKGIEWLNKFVPNWKEFIQLHRLNMEKADRCIVGQLCENLGEQSISVRQTFFTFLVRRDPEQFEKFNQIYADFSMVAHLGFSLTEPESDYSFGTWDLLTDVWLRELGKIDEFKHSAYIIWGYDPTGKFK